MDIQNIQQKSPNILPLNEYYVEFYSAQSTRYC
jgi:hypothetical protein